MLRRFIEGRPSSGGKQIPPHAARAHQHVDAPRHDVDLVVPRLEHHDHAHLTPLPTPSLSSMSDSFLKSKFDMGDRLARSSRPLELPTVCRSSSEAA